MTSRSSEVEDKSQWGSHNAAPRKWGVHASDRLDWSRKFSRCFFPPEEKNMIPHQYGITGWSVVHSSPRGGLSHLWVSAEQKGPVWRICNVAVALCIHQTNCIGHQCPFFIFIFFFRLKISSRNNPIGSFRLALSLVENSCLISVKASIIKWRSLSAVYKPDSAAVSQWTRTRVEEDFIHLHKYRMYSTSALKGGWTEQTE